VRSSARAFINQPDLNARTQTLGNPAFAGAAAFFGHGVPNPHGPETARRGSRGAWRSRRGPAATAATRSQGALRSRAEHYRALRAQKVDSPSVLLKLVAVDVAGNEFPAEKLILEETVLEFE